MKSGDWSLLFHRCVLEQLERLKAASDKAIANSPPNDALATANVKLYAALAKLMIETIPSDPARDEYRQGNTMGPDFRHWRRARIERRFRLFFRYDSRTKVIVYAWVNDEKTLRTITATKVARGRRVAQTLASEATTQYSSLHDRPGPNQ